MSEIDKIKRYIERTPVRNGDKYHMELREAFELASQSQDGDRFSINAITLAFNYGKAKGYRAARAESRKAVRA